MNKQSTITLATINNVQQVAGLPHGFYTATVAGKEAYITVDAAGFVIRSELRPGWWSINEYSTDGSLMSTNIQHDNDPNARPLRDRSMRHRRARRKTI